MANRAMYGPPINSLLPARQARGGLLGQMANPLLYGGLGLLSQGPSLTPISPFQGLGQGLALGMQANQMQRDTALDEQRLEMDRQRLAAEEAARAAKASAPAFTNVPGVGLVQTNAAGGPETVVPVPADPFAGTKSVPGVGLVRMGEEGPEVMVEAKPTTSISLNEAQKPVGEGAQSYVMEDGSQPPPTMTPEQIIAAGGRLMTAGEEAAAKDRAQRAAQQEDAAKRVQDAEAEYDRAYAAWTTEPNAENKRKVDEARITVMGALQSLANEGREFSGPTQRQITPPGAFGRAFEDLSREAVEWWQGQEAPPAPSATPLPVEETIPRTPVGNPSQMSTEELLRMLGG